MRISDWSSDVCSSDLMDGSEGPAAQSARTFARNLERLSPLPVAFWDERMSTAAVTRTLLEADASRARRAEVVDKIAAAYILQGTSTWRSEEHTSELQSLMRISYAGFCLKKKKHINKPT